MKKNDALFPSTTVLETLNGISLRITEQLGEDWMDTSDDVNVLLYNYHKGTLFTRACALNLIIILCETQDKENDVLSSVAKLSFIQNVDCNAHPPGIHHKKSCIF